MTDTMSEVDQASILIVDDTPANLRLLTDMLKKRGYRARPVPSGKLALQAARSEAPDLILLDINMPEMDGFEVCQQLKADEALRDIPVIFISALAETEGKVNAFHAGGVDYVTKPFQFEEVEARVETHIHLRRLQAQLEHHNIHLQTLVQQQVREISDAQMATIFAVAKLAESRDDDTGKHIERVQTFTKALAAKAREHPRFQFGIDDDYIDNVFHSSPLHDIGKVGIPDIVLCKPGRLDDAEFTIMKTHTTIGAETLGAARMKYPRNAFINVGIAIARSHHERWDGTGYPDGLAKEDIPLCARIMSVADVYDALRSRRCYKPPFTHEESCKIIAEESGTHFDPTLAEIFSQIEGEFREIRERLAHQ